MVDDQVVSAVTVDRQPLDVGSAHAVVLQVEEFNSVGAVTVIEADVGDLIKRQDQSVVSGDLPVVNQERFVAGIVGGVADEDAVVSGAAVEDEEPAKDAEIAANVADDAVPSAAVDTDLSTASGAGFHH